MPDDIIIEDQVTEVVIEDQVTEVVIEDVGAQGPAGAGFFISLADTPSTYSGAGGYLVVVTVGEDGLEFSATSPGSSTFAGLTDTPGAVADGEYLVGSGSDLVFVSSIPAADISGLATVATTGSYDDLSDLPVLFSGSYDDLSDVPSTFAPAAHTLGSHSDVDLSGASNGDVLTLSSGEWVPVAPSSGSSAFTGLSDTPGSISAGQYLVGNGGGTALVFVSSIPATDVSGLATVATTGAYSDLSGIPSTFAPSAHTHAASEIISGTFANGRISEGSVTQHESALTITESQISDLQSYLTSEANDLSASVTWAIVPDAFISEGSVTQHESALTITESQISDLGTYSVVGHSHTASDITDFSSAFNASFALSDLDDLSNVSITSNSAGELLRWDGSDWANATLSEAGIAAESHTHTISDVTDAAAVASSNSYDDLDDLPTLVTAFLSLTDTPSSYSMMGGRTVKVNALGTGLEFAVSSAPSTPTFRGIDETPNSYSGEALKVVQVNAAETAVEFGVVLADIASSGSAADLITGSLPDGRVTSGNVTQHEGDLTITESQISDLGTYADASHTHPITDLDSPTNGNIIIGAGGSWTSTSFTGAVGNLNIDALADVTHTSISNGELMVRVGGVWTNQTIAEAGVAAASHNHAASDITSGTLADDRVAESNVTQHADALGIFSPEGLWITSTAYVIGDFVINDGIPYWCKNGHTSGASTEPGIGADWEDEWTRVTSEAVDMTTGTEEPIGYYDGNITYRFRKTFTVVSSATLVNLGALPRTPTRFGKFGGSMNVSSRKAQLPYVGATFSYNLYNISSLLLMESVATDGGTAPNISSGWVIEIDVEYN